MTSRNVATLSPVATVAVLLCLEGRIRSAQLRTAARRTVSAVWGRFLSLASTLDSAVQALDSRLYSLPTPPRQQAARLTRLCCCLKSRPVVLTTPAYSTPAVSLVTPTVASLAFAAMFAAPAPGADPEPIPEATAPAAPPAPVVTLPAAETDTPAESMRAALASALSALDTAAAAVPTEAPAKELTLYYRRAASTGRYWPLHYPQCPASGPTYVKVGRRYKLVQEETRPVPARFGG